MKTIFIGKLVILSMILTSCASIYKEQVVAKMEEKERPEWASLSSPYFVKNSKVYYVGVAEASSSSRIPALMRVSENNARSEISKEINNQINVVFQNVQEDLSEGGQFARLYSSEVSKFLAHGLRTEERYWEKIYIQDIKNGEKLITRSYSLISIHLSDLKKAIREAHTKTQISPAIKKSLDIQIVNEIMANNSNY
jgi:hypothetical protein